MQPAPDRGPSAAAAHVDPGSRQLEDPGSQDAGASEEPGSGAFRPTTRLRRILLCCGGRDGGPSADGTNTARSEAVAAAAPSALATGAEPAPVVGQPAAASSQLLLPAASYGAVRRPMLPSPLQLTAGYSAELPPPMMSPPAPGLPPGYSSNSPLVFITEPAAGSLAPASESGTGGYILRDLEALAGAASTTGGGAGGGLTSRTHSRRGGLGAASQTGGGGALPTPTVSSAAPRRARHGTGTGLSAGGGTAGGSAGHLVVGSRVSSMNSYGSARTSASRVSRWGFAHLASVLSAGLSSFAAQLARVAEPVSGALRGEAVEQLARRAERMDLLKAVAQVADLDLIAQGAERSLVYRGSTYVGGARVPVCVKYMADSAEGMTAPATEGLLSRVLVHPNLIRTHTWHLTRVAAEDLAATLADVLAAAEARRRRQRRREEARRWGFRWRRRQAAGTPEPSPFARPSTVAELSHGGTDPEAPPLTQSQQASEVSTLRLGESEAGAAPWGHAQAQSSRPLAQPRVNVSIAAGGLPSYGPGGLDEPTGSRRSLSLGRLIMGSLRIGGLGSGQPSVGSPAPHRPQGVSGVPPLALPTEAQPHAASQPALAANPGGAPAQRRRSGSGSGKGRASASAISSSAERRSGSAEHGSGSAGTGDTLGIRLGPGGSSAGGSAAPAAATASASAAVSGAGGGGGGTGGGLHSSSQYSQLSPFIHHGSFSTLTAVAEAGAAAPGMAAGAGAGAARSSARLPSTLSGSIAGSSGGATAGGATNGAGTGTGTGTGTGSSGPATGPMQQPTRPQPTPNQPLAAAAAAPGGAAVPSVNTTTTTTATTSISIATMTSGGAGVGGLRTNSSRADTDILAAHGTTPALSSTAAAAAVVRDRPHSANPVTSPTAMTPPPPSGREGRWGPMSAGFGAAASAGGGGGGGGGGAYHGRPASVGGLVSRRRELAVSSFRQREPGGGDAAAAAAGATSATAAAATSGDALLSLTREQMEQGWRKLQQILHRLNVKPGEFLTRIVMEEADRGSLYNAIRGGVFQGAAYTDESTLGPMPSAGAAPGQLATGPSTSSATPGSSSSAPPPLLAPPPPPLPPLAALLLTARDVARGLAHLHAHAVIHGDVKPSNVLLRSDAADPRGYVAMVSDFGLSRIAPHGSIETPEPIGTVSFMAPEVIAGNRYPSSDVWSYGVVLWQLATGSEPWPRLRNMQVMMGVMHGELSLPIPDNLHPSLAALLARCLAHDHTARPSFVAIEAELTTMLKDVYDEGAASAAPSAQLPAQFSIAMSSNYSTTATQSVAASTTAFAVMAAAAATTATTTLDDMEITAAAAMPAATPATALLGTPLQTAALEEQVLSQPWGLAPTMASSHHDLLLYDRLAAGVYSVAAEARGAGEGISAAESVPQEQVRQESQQRPPALWDEEDAEDVQAPADVEGRGVTVAVAVPPNVVSELLEEHALVDDHDEDIEARGEDEVDELQSTRASAAHQGQRESQTHSSMGRSSMASTMAGSMFSRLTRQSSWGASTSANVHTSALLQHSASMLLPAGFNPGSLTSSRPSDTRAALLASPAAAFPAGSGAGGGGPGSLWRSSTGGPWDSTAAHMQAAPRTGGGSSSGLSPQPQGRSRQTSLLGTLDYGGTGHRQSGLAGATSTTMEGISSSADSQVFREAMGGPISGDRLGPSSQSQRGSATGASPSPRPRYQAVHAIDFGDALGRRHSLEERSPHAPPSTLSAVFGAATGAGTPTAGSLGGGVGGAGLAAALLPPIREEPQSGAHLASFGGSSFGGAYGFSGAGGSSREAVSGVLLNPLSSAFTQPFVASNPGAPSTSASGAVTDRTSSRTSGGPAGSRGSRTSGGTAGTGTGTGTDSGGNDLWGRVDQVTAAWPLLPRAGGPQLPRVTRAVQPQPLAAGEGAAGGEPGPGPAPSQPPARGLRMFGSDPSLALPQLMRQGLIVLGVEDNTQPGAEEPGPQAPSAAGPRPGGGA
ncbi:hypothetical protein HYH03_014701 [Edaphochlamys debaryana]|uniref:Protein kinase domain-containing protein n=1 Tax=Edaphochlamys debaryana TaxID=47281 RepID=A0A835XND1_9CHLO|nr:hypothetical protein HYH03_014701 [Edaphochlamys debaryana]|eukprot:KAG2486645.1 hypothetical protein HYH03_014701 [Edaphochlamys debaryana]